MTFRSSGRSRSSKSSSKSFVVIDALDSDEKAKPIKIEREFQKIKNVKERKMSANPDMLTTADRIFQFVSNLLERYLIENRVLVEINFIQNYKRRGPDIQVCVKPVQHT